jgi:hypothetical protein
VELGEREVEDVFSVPSVPEHAGCHEAIGLVQQGQLRDEVADDHVVIRILTVTDEGPDPVDS